MRGWHYWLIGFGLTLVLEAPVVLTLLRHAEPRRERRLVLFLFANLVTHPLVWFFFPLMPFTRRVTITLSELWAFAGETAFYANMSPRLGLGRAALISLLANLTSFSLGWVLTHYFREWLFPL